MSALACPACGSRKVKRLQANPVRKARCQADDCGHQGRVDSFAMEDPRVASWNRSAKQETGKAYR